MNTNVLIKAKLRTRRGCTMGPKYENVFDGQYDDINKLDKELCFVSVSMSLKI